MKTGDRVRLFPNAEDRFLRQSQGGDGTIVEYNTDYPQWAEVVWDNDTQNFYPYSDLGQPLYANFGGAGGHRIRRGPSRSGGLRSCQTRLSQKAPNPFNVGDLIEVVIAGWRDQQVGDRFIVTDINDNCVGWLPGVGGGVFTRYRLVLSAEQAAGASMATDEYEAALEDQEAYQALVKAG